MQQNLEIRKSDTPAFPWNCFVQEYIKNAHNPISLFVQTGDVVFKKAKQLYVSNESTSLNLTFQSKVMCLKKQTIYHRPYVCKINYIFTKKPE